MDRVELLQELVRIPSENNGITGYEGDVVRYYYDFLRKEGIDAQLVYTEKIPNYDSHPGRLIERSLRNRPLVTAALNGDRPGKTLLLLAHADTVPVGSLDAWEESPFSGTVKDGFVYGRGTSDDKWGMAVMASLMIRLKEEGCHFPGKLIIAAVPDEESGGGNGTVGVFASGIKADEAIYLDGGSNLTIWSAGLGGIFARIYDDDLERVAREIRAVKDDIKKRMDAHKEFGPEFFSVIEKQFYLSTKHPDGSISFFMDFLPGEDVEEWKKALEERFPNGKVKFTSRELPSSLVEKDSPLVSNLQKAYAFANSGEKLPAIGGVQSDQGLVIKFGKTPCVCFGCGRRGLPGSSHLPNECVEISHMEKVENALKNYVENYL